jgi:hypothetical protein
MSDGGGGGGGALISETGKPLACMLGLRYGLLEQGHNMVLSQGMSPGQRKQKCHSRTNSTKNTNAFKNKRSEVENED